MSTEPSTRGVVLVAEDERAISDLLRLYISREGYGVHVATDGLAALSAARTLHPIAIVLDVGLPVMDGTEVCRLVRDRADTPIVVLSARGAEKDKVTALDLGADDYMVKPFALDELVARLQALLRRSKIAATAKPSTITVGPLWIDEARRYATVGTTRLDLSRREFDLLATFATNRNLVLTRVRLLELVWGYDFDVDTNVVDVFVGYLRKKLTAAGAPPLIETVRGVGFVLKDR